LPYSTDEGLVTFLKNKFNIETSFFGELWTAQCLGKMETHKFFGKCQKNIIFKQNTEGLAVAFCAVEYFRRYP